MKVAIALFALVAVAAAAPPTSEADAVIIKQLLDNSGIDGYNSAVETSNGIVQEAQGTLINAGKENAAIAVKGSYRYTAPDGVEYEVNYVADENGYQPSAPHLPV